MQPSLRSISVLWVQSCIERCPESPQPPCPLFCAIFHQQLFDKYKFLPLNNWWILVLAMSIFLWICVFLLLSYFSICRYCILPVSPFLFSNCILCVDPNSTLCLNSPGGNFASFQPFTFNLITFKDAKWSRYSALSHVHAYLFC